MPMAPFPLIEDSDTREKSKETHASQGETKPPSDHRRKVGRLRRMLGTGYRDSFFERPELVEDDYYRLINQPRGW